MKRRNVTALGLAGAAAATLPAITWGAAPALPPVEVFKIPDCSCCAAWVAHMEAAGFRVKVTQVEDTAPVRQRQGIPVQFGSCHTAVVAGYALEGHVPAAEVKRLLASRPVAAGLAVPGMPVGAPGMEGGGRKDPFQVLLVDKTGHASVYASYNKA